jgi:phage protein D
LVVISPQFELTVGDYAVHGLTRASVEMTRKKPADACKIEFPNHKAFTLDVFAEGDEVKLSLGFAEFAVAPVFTGTVKEVEPNLPLKIICESVASAARKNAYKETYANSTWKDIAKDALSRGGMTPQLSPFEPPTMPPAKFRVDGHTPAQILDTIAEETGWVWYAVPGTNDGYFGPAWEEPAEQGKTYLFTVGKNVYADDCEIEYVKSRRIKKVIVTLTDGDYKLPPKTAEFKARDYKDGDTEKKLMFVVSKPTPEKATDRAEEEYLKLSTSGFKGSFKAVGNPYITQGSRIALLVPKYDDNVRHATVEAVTHEFGDGAYEMNVTVAGGYE